MHGVPPIASAYRSSASLALVVEPAACTVETLFTHFCRWTVERKRLAPENRVRAYAPRDARATNVQIVRPLGLLDVSFRPRGDAEMNHQPHIGLIDPYCELY